MVIEVLCIIVGIVGCALGDCKIELKIVAGTQCGQKRGNRLGVTPLKGLIASRQARAMINNATKLRRFLR